MENADDDRHQKAAGPRDDDDQTEKTSEEIEKATEAGERETQDSSQKTTSKTTTKIPDDVTATEVMSVGPPFRPSDQVVFPGPVVVIRTTFVTGGALNPTSSIKSPSPTDSLVLEVSPSSTTDITLPLPAPTESDISSQESAEVAPTGLIVGISVGAATALLLFAMSFFLVARHRRKKESKLTNHGELDMSGIGPTIPSLMRQPTFPNLDLDNIMLPMPTTYHHQRDVSRDPLRSNPTEMAQGLDTQYGYGRIHALTTSQTFSDPPHPPSAGLMELPGDELFYNGHGRRYDQYNNQPWPLR